MEEETRAEDNGESQKDERKPKLRVQKSRELTGSRNVNLFEALDARSRNRRKGKLEGKGEELEHFLSQIDAKLDSASSSESNSSSSESSQE